MLNFHPSPVSPAKRTRATTFRHGDRLADLIERAAGSLGIDKSAFIRDAVEREAARVIEAQSVHVLTQREADQFSAALDAPSDPPPNAVRAGRNYRKRVVHAD